MLIQFVITNGFINLSLICSAVWVLETVYAENLQADSDEPAGDRLMNSKLCQVSLIHRCRAEGAAPPLARASFRRSAAVAGRSHRKPRSRSSPVRIGAENPGERPRSPSVSPPRVSPAPVTVRAAHPACARAPLATLATLEHRHHLVKQRSAFFSLRPPAVPLRLMCAGASAPPATTPVGPPAKCIPPPPPLRSQAKDFPAPTQEHEPQKPRKSGGKCRRLVRRLLTEMLAALPLAAPPAESCTVLSCTIDERPEETSLPPVSSCSHTTVAAPKTPAAPRASDCRSVAVQALATRKNADNDDFCYSIDKSQKDGWVGGVRALRDSHVRLVLRQLRHIERLNRALDHAARPPAGDDAPACHQCTPRPL